jgi:SulP family sulfate permease
MNRLTRFQSFLQGLSFQANKRAWKIRRHNGPAALVTFFAAVGYAPYVELGIVVGAGIALVLYLQPP